MSYYVRNRTVQNAVLYIVMRRNKALQFVTALGMVSLCQTHKLAIFHITVLAWCAILLAW